MLDRQTSDILQALYAASVDPQQWAVALERVGAAVGAVAGALEFVSYRKGDWHALCGFGYDQAEAANNPELADWTDHDPWVPCVEAEPESDLIIGTKFVPASQYLNTTFHNDYARAIDAHWRDVLAVAPRFGADVVGIFALYRHVSAEDFGYREVARIEALKPHIINALTIASRFNNLATLNQASQQLLDSRAEALLVLDQEGGVVFCNRVAESLFARARPVLGLRKGRLRLNDPRANERFQVLLSAHLSVGEGPSSAALSDSSMAWTDPQTMRPFSLCLTPHLPSLSPEQFTFSPSRPTVAVTISDFSSRADRIAARMQQAFDLTAAEAGVLELLIDGAKPDDICAQRGVTMNTVRAQLKALFRKTGASSQAELINRSLLGFR